MFGASAIAFALQCGARCSSATPRRARSSAICAGSATLGSRPMTGDRGGSRRRDRRARRPSARERVEQRYRRARARLRPARERLRRRGRRARARQPRRSVKTSSSRMGRRRPPSARPRRCAASSAPGTNSQERQSAGDARPAQAHTGQRLAGRGRAARPAPAVRVSFEFPQPVFSPGAWTLGCRSRCPWLSGRPRGLSAPSSAFSALEPLRLRSTKFSSASSPPMPPGLPSAMTRAPRVRTSARVS
jgi:hypothetical protein